MTTTLAGKFNKLTTEEIRENAAVILEASGHQLEKYNGRSHYIHARRNDGRLVLLYVYRNISTASLKWSLSDENLFASKVIG